MYEELRPIGQRRPKLLSRRFIITVLGVAGVVFLLGLPFLAGTSTYPIAIVDGDSMVPTLHYGDLVFFTGVNGPIKNGTIIVFIQGQSGVPMLDSLLKSTVIHRVVGMGTEPDGTTYYETKGDNNLQKDPFVTDQGNVLGVYSFDIPYAGLPILFLKTPFGMVSLTALISMYYFSDIDTKFDAEEERKRIVAVFARHTLNGEIDAKEFERLKLAVEYCDDIPMDLVTSPTIISLVDWLKAGGLSAKWKEESRDCPSCGSRSICLVFGERSFAVCPVCTSRSTQH